MNGHEPSTGFPAHEAGSGVDADASHDPLVDECLRLSSFIFDEMNRRLKEQKTADKTIRLERSDAKTIKKSSLSINRAFTEYVKKAHEREDLSLIHISEPTRPY